MVEGEPRVEASPHCPPGCFLCKGLERISRVGHSGSLNPVNFRELIDHLRVLYGQLLDLGGVDRGVGPRSVAADPVVPCAPEVGSGTKSGRAQEQEAASTSRAASLKEAEAEGKAVESEIEPRKREKVRLPKPLTPRAAFIKAEDKATSQDENFPEAVTSSPQPDEKKKDIFLEVKVEHSSGEEEDVECTEVRTEKVAKSKKRHKSHQVKEEKSKKEKPKKSSKKSRSPSRKARNRRRDSEEKRPKSPSVKLVEKVPRSPSHPPPGFEDSQPRFGGWRAWEKREDWNWERDHIPSRYNNPHLRSRSSEVEPKSKGRKRRERWEDIKTFGPSKERKQWFEARQHWRWEDLRCLPRFIYDQLQVEELWPRRRQQQVLEQLLHPRGTLGEFGGQPEELRQQRRRE